MLFFIRQFGIVLSLYRSKMIITFEIKIFITYKIQNYFNLSDFIRLNPSSKVSKYEKI